MVYCRCPSESFSDLHCSTVCVVDLFLINNSFPVRGAKGNARNRREARLGRQQCFQRTLNRNESRRTRCGDASQETVIVLQCADYMKRHQCRLRNVTKPYYSTVLSNNNVDD